MAQIKFGSKGSTGRKLNVINEYLSMYQNALKSQPFKTVYIDAFAGTGEIPLTEHTDDLFDEDVQSVIAGSADRAMNIDPPFSRYCFIDKRKKCIDALQEKFKNNENLKTASFITGDANEELQRICREQNWKNQRGVVLLDPFGNQVHWETIEAIANTRALDLWYLFPAGNGVFRQIANDGTVDPTHEPSITRLFGNEEWKTAFLKPKVELDLFDEPRESYEKTVTPESAAEFMIEQLRSVFKGGVLDEMIPLGKLSYTSFYLLFAWSNPSSNVRTLANKLSRAALKATDRKDGRII